LLRVAARIGTPYFLAKPFPPQALLRLVGLALRERVAPAPPRR
jgi:hypothetical protein